ncbi:MAG: chloride channel protein, partial [Oscillospiraceae bacterium]|nr:chloride channel protein [Oscillospiraceae bacterium]
LKWISLVPALVASYTAYFLSISLGTPPTRFDVPQIVSGFDVKTLLLVIVLSGLCGAVSIMFCQSMHYVHKGYERVIKNPYIRVFVGGVIVIILTLLLDTNDYNCGGMNIVAKAIEGEVVPYAFLLKILFTALTLGAGFKGGEIVPTMFIGATFGCFMGEILGLSPQFAAAIGLVAVFCGCVNCPTASIILSIELFGISGIIYFVLACLISFVLSGKYCLYKGKEKLYEETTIGFIKTTINKMKK